MNRNDILDTLAEVAAYAATPDPSRPSWAGNIAICAGDGYAALLTPPPSPTTNHARIAWAHLLGRAKAALAALSEIGAAWGSVGVLFHVAHRNGATGYRLQWAPDGVVQSIQATPKTAWTAAAPAELAERLDLLLPGPSGAHTWDVAATRLARHTLIAGDAREALRAAYALWHGPLLPEALIARDLGLPIRIEPMPPVPDWRAAATAPSPLRLLQKALRSAQIVARSAAGSEEEQSVEGHPQLIAHTVFEDAHTVGVPIDCHWHALPYSVEIDEKAACAAQHALGCFLAEVCDLPGLVGTPIAALAELVLYGEQVAGVDLVIRTADQGAHPDHVLHTTAKSFTRQWAPRLGVLAAMAAPTDLWMVGDGSFAQGRIVSAASPQEALIAAQAIWGMTPTRLGWISPLP